MDPTSNEELLSLAREHLTVEYDVTRVLGRGGMGIVLGARERALDRAVAIKVLTLGVSGRSEAAAQLLREARLAARLEHPGVVPVYRVGSTEAFDYVVMRFVDGPSLEQVVARHGAVPPLSVLLVLRTIAGALAAAHDDGILHRDVKAANVMLERSGRPFLTDFGIASSVHEAADHGVIAGTPTYLAPEVITGAPPSVAADEYALGVLGHLLLTGRLPFEGGSLAELLRQHVTSPPPPLVSVHGEIPHGLSAAVTRALAKSPRDRHGSMAALIRALDDVRLRPEQRTLASEHLNRMAVGAWPLANQAPSAPIVTERVAPIRSTVIPDPGRVPPRPRVTRDMVPSGVSPIRATVTRAAVISVMLVALGVWIAWGEQIWNRLTYVETSREAADRAALVRPPTPGPEAIPDSGVAEPALPATAAEDDGATSPLLEGIRLLESGQTAEAIVLLRRAEAADSADATAVGYLACALRRMGNERDADRALARTGGVPGPWSWCARRASP